MSGRKRAREKERMNKRDSHEGAMRLDGGRMLIHELERERVSTSRQVSAKRLSLILSFPSLLLSFSPSLLLSLPHRPHCCHHLLLLLLALPLLPFIHSFLHSFIPTFILLDKQQATNGHHTSPSNHPSHNHSRRLGE